MKRIFTSAIIILSLLLLTVGCSTKDQQAEPKKEPAQPVSIQVMLDWVPNTNHTGLYVAKEKGWYKEQGLNVEIVQPGDSGTAQMVAAGKAQFGISAQEEVANARSQNIPLVSIGAIIQHNTSGFASPKEKNIVSPKDFEGKSYGGWGAESEKAVIKSVMEKSNADFNKVKILTVGDADFFNITKRDVDFEWIYYGWTGIDAELRKFPINYIELRKIAPELDYYTPVIITNEAYIKDHPDVIKKFMAATAKGYEYSISNPEEASSILIKEVPGMNAELVKASQKWLSAKYQEDASQWGIQKPEVWETYTNWMVNHKLIPSMIDVKKAFTNDFLPKK
ncbi:ABC transporter substrate-binding protein [Tepidibacillus marianensis]|uniref:ABC transporter substrate-binding protein n=1 Tax=Tepidibacillus marianensis TaxID=3131995 RepID=UPI0030CA6461